MTEPITAVTEVLASSEKQVRAPTPENNSGEVQAEIAAPEANEHGSPTQHNIENVPARAVPNNTQGSRGPVATPPRGVNSVAEPREYAAAVRGETTAMRTERP